MAPPTGRSVTIGVDVLEPGDSVVEIRKVSLVQAEGVSLAGAYVTPVRNTTAVGSFDSFPPSTSELEERGYRPEDLVPAVGVTLDPEVAPAWSLLIGLAVDQGWTSGRAAAVEVDYRSGLRVYVWRNSTELEVRLPPEACF